MRRLLWPAIAAAAAFAILVSLGVWQLQRMQWKEALIARVEAGLTAEPAPAPGPEEWPALAVGDAEYRAVTVSGRYLNDQEIFVNETLTEPNGPLGGFGFFVMTPFHTDGGWIVYVNRGFVPRDRKAPETRNQGMIDGDATVVGLLRQPRHRAWFMPSDDVAQNEWFSRDPVAFAAAQGRSPTAVAPYYIDARFDPALPGGLPQGGETIVSFPNNHLQYALTWFGLAAGLAAVFALFARSRLRDEGP
jgi:surfeit locus 1 family protein